MQNVKILVEVDRFLAERFLDLARRGAFGASAASSSVNLNKIVNKVIHRAIMAGEKKLIREQRKRDEVTELKASTEAVTANQRLRFTRQRGVSYSLPTTV